MKALITGVNSIGAFRNARRAIEARNGYLDNPEQNERQATTRETISRFINSHQKGVKGQEGLEDVGSAGR